MSVPTEILGISKLYSISSRSDSETYIRIVKTLQELKILDVAHVVRRGLEEDPSGSWSALKKATDDDLAAAKKFVEDLNTFLTSLERLIDSLDVSTPKDGFNEKFADFLSEKTADGLTDPAARGSSIKSVANVSIQESSDSSSLTNVDLISLILHQIRVRSTGVEDLNSKEGRAVFELLSVLGQTTPYDYNSVASTRSPKIFIPAIASEFGVSSLELCVYALSNTFNLSAGITRLKKIRSEVGLPIVSNISDADKVFDGVKVAKIEQTGVWTSNVLYQRKLSDGSLLDNTYALKVARYDDGAKKIAPCEKPINITLETGYASGETSLIRDSMAANDFNFQKLSLYTDQLESSLEQLQKVTESLVGFMDTENELTPFAVFSKILESAAAALELAGKDDLNKYQLLALLTLETNLGAHAQSTEDYLVRSIGVLKYARVMTNSQSKAGSESSKSTVTLETSRTSEGSDSVQSDASVKTVETVSSARDSSGSEARVIGRAASTYVQTPGDIMDAAYEIPDVGLEELATRLNAAEQAYEAALQHHEESTMMDELQIRYRLLRITQTYDVYLAAKSAFETAKYQARNDGRPEIAIFDAFTESMRKEGTIFSLILDLYDELTIKSSNRAGENESIVNSSGYTNYGKMDEYAILSLIISCFSQIFAGVIPSGTGLTGGEFNFSQVDLERSITSIKNSLGAGGRELRTTIDYRLYGVRRYVESYQNVYAFLDAYLKNIRESRLLAISSFSEVSKDLSFTSDAGRLKSLANVTRHSIAARHALLRKWEPIEASGYLSRFSSTVASIDYTRVLNSYRVPNTYEDNSLQNMRVLHVGVPASTIVSDSAGGTQFINVVVGKLDHRYYLPDTFVEKSFIFDPTLFVGDLGDDPGTAGASLESRSNKTTFYFFDRNGSSGPYSYRDLIPLYQAANPGFDTNFLSSVILNCYNSAMIEAYQYYTSGIVLDESTATGVDTSISPAGLSALGLLSGLNLPDVSLPPGTAISSAFSDGHINLEETASGLSSSKKEILSNVASSYLFKSNRILDRIARNFDHDRVFLIPVDPDSFIVNATPDFIAAFGTQNLSFQVREDGRGLEAQLTDQDPTNNGMMAGGFYAQILAYPTVETPGDRVATAYTGTSSRPAPGMGGDAASGAKSRDERGTDTTLRKMSSQSVSTASSTPTSDAKKAPATMKKFNPKKRG